MCATLHPAFSDFLLRVGEGKEPFDENKNITLPDEIGIPYKGSEDSLDELIQNIFVDVSLCSRDLYQMINRYILSSKNSSVDDINEIMINKFQGELHVFTSSDKVIDEKYQGDEYFLNSLSPKVLPPHKLLLKQNCPIIFLENLNPSEGLYNGTRFICRELRKHTIYAEIILGQHNGKIIFLPKIPLQSPTTESMEFRLCALNSL